MEVVFESFFVFNKGQKGVICDELGAKELLHLLPIFVDTFQAKISVERVNISTSNDSNPGM